MKINKLTKEIWMTCGSLLYANKRPSGDLGALLSAIDELRYILATELRVKPSESFVKAAKDNKAFLF